MLINFKTYSTCKDPNYDKRMKVYIFFKQLHSYDSHSVLFIYQYIYVIYFIMTFSIQSIYGSLQTLDSPNPN